MNNEKSDHLEQHLREAAKIMIFTGAGVSTGSGIPDYRGPSGVWKTQKPVMYQDFMTSEEARVEYWGQKQRELAQFQDARPNRTHSAIADLEYAGVLLMLVTQNIDGLHE